MHYYNEIDDYAATWIENLILDGQIPDGHVDRRSVVDVVASDLSGYAQCHFFAGIAGWALAARLAGWPEDRELWTGSCPCQPFSVAGAQRGVDDERHLWPYLFRLIRARRPAVFMGEQVAAAVGKDWFDGVCADLEGVGYSCGAAVIPACAVDGPHRRDRLWFVADREQLAMDYEECLPIPRDGFVGNGVGARLEGHARDDSAALGRPQPDRSAPTPSGGRTMGDTDIARASEERQQRGGQLGGAGSDPGDCFTCGKYWDDCTCVLPGPLTGDVADGDCEARRSAPREPVACGRGGEARIWPIESGRRCGSAWGGASWIIGHDGKARRVEPGIRLLAHGVSDRVGRLRAYGNAIVPQVAAEVIAAYMDCRP